jgi:hypothetical protein
MKVAEVVWENIVRNGAVYGVLRRGSVLARTEPRDDSSFRKFRGMTERAKAALFVCAILASCEIVWVGSDGCVRPLLPDAHQQHMQWYGSQS